MSKGIFYLWALAFVVVVSMPVQYWPKIIDVLVHMIQRIG